MQKEKAMRIEELKQRIACSDYVVDPAAVANAIVERTLARHRDALDSLYKQSGIPWHPGLAR